MSSNILIRAFLVALLLSLCLGAGLIGGIDFPPDAAVIRHFQAVRAASPGLTLSAIAVTQAGSAWATIGGGLGVGAWLAWRRRLWPAAVLVATVVIDRIAIDGLKLLIDRTRPSFDLHPVLTHSSSFPSGHSGNTMAVFLTIALIAAPGKYRLAAVATALSASFIIGMTRPYLGVHWPTDVLGGWALGAAIAIIAWSIAEARGPVATPGVSSDGTKASDCWPASGADQTEQSHDQQPQH